MGRLKKSLGQNFLVDANIIKKIIGLQNLKGKNILEIGPGLGALTQEIIKKRPKSLTLIEKDYDFYNKLITMFKDNKKVKLYNADILKFNLEKFVKKETIIFGNLPYNISSQILVKLVKFKKWPPNYTKLILMFQKELAEKIIGKFNTINYGRLSILANYRLNVFDKFNVSPNCFSPKPKVTSTVLEFLPKDNIPEKIENIDNLERITNIFFSNKRKMINKNIIKIFGKNKINILKKINLESRPSEVSPELYYKITRLYESI